MTNRDPGEVTADGKVYCFQDTLAPGGDSASVLLQLVDGSTLKAEHRDGPCPESPAFSNPTTYVR